MRRLAWRVGFYLVVVGYLWLDLAVWGGPLSRGIEQARTRPAQRDREFQKAAGVAGGVAAVVYGQPIFWGQVEERVKALRWRRGLEGGLEKVSGLERQQWEEWARNELIEERLVKVQIKVSPAAQYAVDEGELEAALRVWEAKFSEEEWAALWAQQGWAGKKEMRARLAARWQQERYIRSVVEVEGEVEEGEDPVGVRRKWELFMRLLRHEAGDKIQLFSRPEAGVAGD